ncbi:hypothetical protein [Cupriavidus necator]
MKRERLYTFAVSARDMFSHQSVVAPSDQRAWRKLIESLDMCGAIKVTLINVDCVGPRSATENKAEVAGMT